MAYDVKDSSLYAHTGGSVTVIDVKIFSRRVMEKDERSSYIEMQQIEDLSKNKYLKISLLQESTREAISKLVTSKKLTNNVGSLKADTVLKAQNIKSLPIKSLFKITVSDSEIMDKIESIALNYEKQVGE